MDELKERIAELEWFRDGAMSNINNQAAHIADLERRLAEVERETIERCEAVAREMFNRAADGDEIADAIRALAAGGKEVGNGC